jgi:methyltransferase
MRALGDRWTVRIVTLPKAQPVTSGIYKYFRHPIYLGVSLELAGIPLLHSAYVTAILFSVLNRLVLRIRIREEEKALRGEGGYDEAFGL